VVELNGFPRVVGKHGSPAPLDLDHLQFRNPIGAGRTENRIDRSIRTADATRMVQFDVLFRENPAARTGPQARLKNAVAAPAESGPTGEVVLSSLMRSISCQGVTPQKHYTLGRSNNRRQEGTVPPSGGSWFRRRHPERYLRLAKSGRIERAATVSRWRKGVWCRLVRCVRRPA
jgi:hypothetical protein